MAFNHRLVLAAAALLPAKRCLPSLPPLLQVLVDLFVNYDCSLQAANLYERSIKAIRKLMALPEGTGAALPPAVTQARRDGAAVLWLCGQGLPTAWGQWQGVDKTADEERTRHPGHYTALILPRTPPRPAPQKLKATALNALLATIKSLDTWAGPIKSAAEGVALTADAAVAGGAPGADGGEGNGGSEGELAAQPRGREVRQGMGGHFKPFCATCHAQRAGFLQSALQHAAVAQLALPPLKQTHKQLRLQELRRILADKELKEALLAGIQQFNTGSAVKGAPRGRPLQPEVGSPGAAPALRHGGLVSPPGGSADPPCLLASFPCPPNNPAHAGLRALVRSGVIPDASPAAAAAFLREHAARLDKGQVGELFGHHEDHSIAVGCGCGLGHSGGVGSAW